MKKNIRFIKTKVSSDDTYLILTKCDYCPYFSKDKYIGKLRCGKSYNSPNNDNVISNDVRFTIKNNNLVPEKEGIDIPEWCVLSKKMQDEMNNKRIVYKSQNFIYEFLSPYKKGIDRIMPDGYVELKYESDALVYNEHGQLYFDNQVKRNVTTPIDNKPSEYRHLPELFDSSTYVSKVESKICSCCGEDKKEVDRSVNFGMCNECFVKNDNNKLFKYKSYINNFRLKRKSNWIDDNFKIINNLI